MKVSKSAMIHVEVLDASMNPEYIVAVPARCGEMFCYDRGFYTTISIEHVLQIPGSFIARRLIGLASIHHDVSLKIVRQATKVVDSESNL